MVINDYCEVFQENKTKSLSHKIFRFSNFQRFWTQIDVGLNIHLNVSPSYLVTAQYHTQSSINFEIPIHNNFDEKQKGRLYTITDIKLFGYTVYSLRISQANT